MMRRIIATGMFIFACVCRCFAQETEEQSNRLTDNVTEKFNVLKSDGKTRQGLYQAVYKRRFPVASGGYEMGKRVNVWHFYDYQGHVIENFNYDTQSFAYEAREDTTSHMRYRIDKKISDTDMVTKPLRIGGRYYGYIPYLQAFKVPFDLYEVSPKLFTVQLELLVSPLGQLADYKVHVLSYYYRYEQTFTFDVKLFSEEDRKFFPATLNGEPVLSRIFVNCILTNDGGIDFYN